MFSLPKLLPDVVFAFILIFLPYSLSQNTHARTHQQKSNKIKSAKGNKFKQKKSTKIALSSLYGGPEVCLIYRVTFHWRKLIFPLLASINYKWLLG